MKDEFLGFTIECLHMRRAWVNKFGERSFLITIAIIGLTLPFQFEFQISRWLITDKDLLFGFWLISVREDIPFENDFSTLLATPTRFFLRWFDRCPVTTNGRSHHHGRWLHCVEYRARRSRRLTTASSFSNQRQSHEHHGRPKDQKKHAQIQVFGIVSWRC